MPVPPLALQSSLQADGRPGGCNPAGTLMTETLAGQKASDLNSLFTPYSSLTVPLHCLRFMGTIRESLKCGGKDTAGTSPPTLPSGESMQPCGPPPIRFSCTMCPVDKTHQTAPPMVTIPPPLPHSLRCPSHLTSHILSATTTTCRPGASASGIDFNLPPPNPPVPPAHCHITRYPVNLTPMPSELCPHCAAPDRIKLWLPHLTSIAAYRPDILQEAQERVHTVTLHAWTASTRTAYGTGLLVYHTFCSIHEIPKEDRAPAEATLIAQFISALAGQYAGQTIQGYVYGLHA